MKIINKQKLSKSFGFVMPGICFLTKRGKKLGRFAVDKMVDIIAVIIALYALQISNDSLEQTQKQFEQSSKSADSLFTLQLDNARQLNDSLISQISGLQKITSSQLRITDLQLQVMQQSLKEQIYSDRPKIVVSSNSITDTSAIIKNTFSPVITTELFNVGKRFADNLTIRPFFIDLAISSIKDFRDLSLRPSFLEPNGSRSIEIKPKIPIPNKNEFYYCYEITYYDAIIHQRFSQSYFAKLYKSRGDYHFYACSESEILKLKAFINLHLEIKGDPLLKEDNF